MAGSKTAQNFDINELNMSGFILPVSDFPSLETNDNIEVSEDDDDQISFSLDDIPGAPDAQEIVIQEPDEAEVVEVDIDGDGEPDVWKWEHKTFLNWIKNMFDNVPKHSGHDTTGLEKAIAYFEALNKEITKAMRTDYKNEIDAAQAERAREQIEDGIARLLDRLEKVNSTKYKKTKKKKAGLEYEGMVKEAQKATHINGIVITVPLLISRIARVCINSMVSAGKDIEDTFEKQSKLYNLDKRERAEVAQLLADMNYPMIQDRGFDVGEAVDKESPNNFDWAQQFRG